MQTKAKLLSVCVCCSCGNFSCLFAYLSCLHLLLLKSNEIEKHLWLRIRNRYIDISLVYLLLLLLLLLLQLLLLLMCLLFVSRMWLSATHWTKRNEWSRVNDWVCTKRIIFCFAPCFWTQTMFTRFGKRKLNGG